MSGGAPKRGLGRGLSALLGDDVADVTPADPARTVRQVAIGDLVPGRFQPRRHFDSGEMASLVASVRERGVLQPLLVRPHPDGSGRFEIVAGERRWRAAQKASLHDVPALVLELGDHGALEVALVENLQREDLTPIEEAAGYRQLMSEFSHTQQALAAAVGKSRSHVANMLRLLRLPDGVQAMLADGRLSAGHGRALLGADDPMALARRIVEGGLNVRQAEDLGRKDGKSGGAGRRRRRKPPAADADTLALERSLSDQLGLAVTIRSRGAGGSLTVSYDTLEQLDDLLRRLGEQPV